MSIEFIKKGRTGNNLFQYFISRFLADQYQLNFKNNFFSPVLDFKPLNIYNNNYEQTIYINDTNIYRILDTPQDFNNSNLIIDGYFQDSLFFNDKYQLLLNYVFLESIKDKNMDDIVIHIRINDFNKDGKKSNVIHPNWYLNILDKETFTKLYIVIDINARKKYSYQDKEQNYLNYFNKYNPIIINSSEKDDFNFIRSFDKIISSNSTFSWWTSYFSEATTIYSPTHWRGKKKLQNIRNISSPIDTFTCDIHILNIANNYSDQNHNDVQNIVREHLEMTNYLKHNQNCVVVLSNKKYFNKAINTIKKIREIGNWDGDLVFVYGNNITKEDLEELQTYLVIPKYFPDFDLSQIELKLKDRKYKGLDRKLGKMFCFHKFHLFDPYFKHWNKIFYIDCGMQIHQNIRSFFDVKCGKNLLANSDAYPKYRWKLAGQFNPDSYPEIYKSLSTRYNLNVDYFQSTILLYNSKIIQNDTKYILKNLLDTYFIGFTNDQAIMNLYFNCEINIWKQIPFKKDNKLLYDYKARTGNKKNNYIMTKI